MMINYLFSAIITPINPNMNQQQTWKKFDDISYTIMYPGDWDLNTGGANNTSFILVAPGTEKKAFRENINLLISKLPNSEIGIDFFAKASEQQIAANFQNSELIESTRVRTDDTEYQKMIYTGSRNGIELKFTQRYWVIDGVAYVLTFSSNNDTWDQLASTVEGVFDTFTLK